MDNSPLRRLPREIREMIYSMALHVDRAIDLTNLQPYTALAEVCREERAPALACLFRGKKLCIPRICKLDKLDILFESLGTDLVLKIQYLRYLSASESDRRILVDAEFYPDPDMVPFVPQHGNDKFVARAYAKVGLRLVEVNVPKWSSKYGWFGGKSLRPCPCQED